MADGDVFGKIVFTPLMAHPPAHRRRLRHRARSWPGGCSTAATTCSPVARSEERADELASRPRRRAGAGGRPRRPRVGRVAGAARRRSTRSCTRPASSSSARSPSSASTPGLASCEVNLVAPAALTRVALPALRAARGTVVFVNSGAGQVAHPDLVGVRRLEARAARARRLAAGRGGRARRPGHHRLPGPDRDPDAGEGARARRARTYDADAWIRPETVADAILHVLDLRRRRDRRRTCRSSPR